MNFNEIENKSWMSILNDNGFKYQPPVTVHLPIQPAGSPDVVHVDSALTVCRKRILPNLTASSILDTNRRLTLDTFVAQFAFGNPPFVPDFKCSNLKLKDGLWPVVEADYFAYDLYYQLEYSCCEVDEKQELLCVKVNVTNEGECEHDANVFCKINIAPENEIYEYHYAPFFWNNSRWTSCKRVVVKDEQILFDDSVTGKIESGDFKFEWLENADNSDAKYNKLFTVDMPYFVDPSMQLKKIDNTMKFSTKLKQGEKKEFSLFLLVNYEDVEKKHISFMDDANAQSVSSAALQGFKEQFKKETTTLNFPEKNWENIFQECQTSTLQLLIKFPGVDSLMPTQGGSSERHYVWVWEAFCMLTPMLKLGHFDAIKKAIDFIFSLQDGGCPPEGEFTTTEGAIGTTGPRWINSTGAALSVTADYYQYSKDDSFLDEYLPKIKKAMSWIVGEIRATRKLDENGNRPPYYGLMPFGCATDADTGYFPAFTDSYTFMGLEKGVNMLLEIDDKDASEFKKELELYREDIATVMKYLRREDGYIERKIITDKTLAEGEVCEKFENGSGALVMPYAGCFDPNSELFDGYLHYFEDNLMEGEFTNRMDREVLYIGFTEYMWQHSYLWRKEWKKAFLATQTNMKYGMTQDTHQVQERFSMRNPGYTPWQPNGSGNGRMLDMMIKSLYFENNEEVALFGGIPFLWLKENKNTSLKNFYTLTGQVSLEAEVNDQDICKVTLTCNKGSLPKMICIPEHFIVKSSEAVSQEGELFKVEEGAKKIVFELIENTKV